MSLNVTQEPPSTVGGGIVLAAAGAARFVPLMVTNEPGLKFGVPSLEFTMPRAPVVIVGRVPVPAGVVETTLSPESVIAYALPLRIRRQLARGQLARVVPKTFVTGFSGTTPASVSSPVWMLTISSVVRGSSRVAVVMFCRTGVVSRRKHLSSMGATAATLRLPVLTIVWVGNWPGCVGKFVWVAPGFEEPPMMVIDEFMISPSARR